MRDEALAQARILIVDDEVPNVQLLERLLQRTGYANFQSTTDSREVLQRFTEMQSDLILLDLHMPHLDGFAVLEQVRAAVPQGDYLPILVLTADATPAAKRQALTLGATDFLTKPFDVTEVQLRIRNLLETRFLHRQLQGQNQILEDKVRERTQELVRAREAALEAQRRAHLGSWEWDRNGEGGSWSDELYRIFGLHPQAIAASYRAYLQRVHPSDRQLVEQVIERARHERRPFDLDHRIVRADGTVGIVHMQMEAVDNEWSHSAMLIGTTHDITERKRAELLLEAERRRVAYDLHDGLAQVLTSTHQHLQTFAAHHRPRAPQARQDLNRVLELAQLAVREARRMIAGLRPTVLDDFGLAAALRLQIEALRADGWNMTYDEALGVERLPPAVETALFWVVQEGITNIRKHASTTCARLALTRHAHVIRLELQDQGRGFQLSASSSLPSPGEHVGLLSMQERIAMVGGSLNIHSQPGAGTLIVAEVPLAPVNEGEMLHAD